MFMLVSLNCVRHFCLWSNSCAIGLHNWLSYVFKIYGMVMLIGFFILLGLFKGSIEVILLKILKLILYRISVEDDKWKIIQE